MSLRMTDHESCGLTGAVHGPEGMWKLLILRYQGFSPVAATVCFCRCKLQVSVRGDTDAMKMRRDGTDNSTKSESNLREKVL